MSGSSPRRPYQQPELKRLGSIVALTEDHKKMSGPPDLLGQVGISHGDSLKP